MKILINAINARLGGGQTYLRNLLAHIPADQQWQITLLTAPSAGQWLDVPSLIYLTVPGWVERRPLLRPVWESLVLPKLLQQGGYDVLFCPGGVVNTVPPPGCKLVTMFRNMLPFDERQRQRYPAFSYQRLRNWLLARVMLRGMRQADLVIFIADYARQVIESQPGMAVKSSVVIPHGIGEQFRYTGEQPPPRLTAMPQRYLLYVSNVDVYKAQLEVVAAFAHFHRTHPDVSLVFIGPERAFYADQVRAKIAQSGLNDAVHMLGNVPYTQLPAWYQHAEANIFASECENCPNILLEAMASGRPVVCSNFPPMPEFGGDAVVYFDPSQPESLLAALTQVLDDPALGHDWAQRAHQRSRDYTWPKAAAATWRAIAGLGS